MKPQLVVISVAIILVILSRVEQLVLFRAFHFMLITIFTFCFVFQSMYVVWNWMDPNRGLAEVDGKMVRVGMDISGIPIGAFSLIIAILVALMNLNANKRNAIKVETHLAIATIITSGLVFIYFELI